VGVESAVERRRRILTKKDEMTIMPPPTPLLLPRPEVEDTIVPVSTVASDASNISTTTQSMSSDLINQQSAGREVKATVHCPSIHYVDYINTQFKSKHTVVPIIE
jgi:hypothetical protein